MPKEIKNNCYACEMKKQLDYDCPKDFFKSCPHNTLLSNEDKLREDLQVLTNKNWELTHAYNARNK